MTPNNEHLEKRRFVHFQIGLIAAAAICLSAFTWTEFSFSKTTTRTLTENNDLELEPVVSVPVPKPPAPPRLQLNVVNLLPQVRTHASTNPALAIPSDLSDLGDLEDWSEEGYEEEGSITLSTGPMAPGRVQRAARYASCEGDNPIEELQCTRNRMIELVQQLAIYPAFENEAGIEGKAKIAFVIDEKGMISQAEIAQQTTPGFGREALKAVQQLPPMLPALQLGKPTAVFFEIPVHFVLNLE